MKKTNWWFIGAAISAVLGFAACMCQDAFLTPENPLTWLIAVGVPLIAVGAVLFIIGLIRFNKTKK